MKKNNFSKEHIRYLRKVRLKTISVVALQIIILVAFFTLWEVLGRYDVIDTYMFSSPSRIWKMLKTLYESGVEIDYLGLKGKENGAK